MAACSAAIATILLAGCGSSSIIPAPQQISASQVPARTGTAVRPLTSLNSPADEFGLTMPIDSTIAFFTSAKSGGPGKQSIYYARRTGSVWTVPALAVEINNAQSNGAPSITPGGESLYFTGCDYGLGDCDLYRVDVGPRGSVPNETIPWTIPTNLGLGINGFNWDSQPCVAADGSILYFSSDRPGGFGGKDIWYCRRMKDGSWNTPINAGPKINTAFDEVSPWLSPDGATLFFSSNGQPGIGGFDIFETHSLQSGNTVVTNLGTPINSSADEITFSLSSDGTHAFMASNRSGGTGGYDLYEIAPSPVQLDPFVIVRGTVRDQNGRPLVAMVEAADLTSNTPLGRFMTNPDSGTYTAVLPRGYDYGLTAVAPDHLFLSKQVPVERSLEHRDERRVDFQLSPLNGTTPLLVFFDPGESNLLHESVNDLTRVVDLLQDDPKLTIEIAGHTDNVGDDGANFALSSERARAVRSFLIGNRIDADRVKATGYGPTQPIADNGTESGRAMNRRVELRIATQ